MSIMPPDPDSKPDPCAIGCCCGHPCSRHVAWSQGEDCRDCDCERIRHGRPLPPRPVPDVREQIARLVAQAFGNDWVTCTPAMRALYLADADRALQGR